MLFSLIFLTFNYIENFLNNVKPPRALSVIMSSYLSCSYLYKNFCLGHHYLSGLESCHVKEKNEGYIGYRVLFLYQTR